MNIYMAKNIEENKQDSKSSAIDKLLDIIECLYSHGGKAKINTIATDLNLYKSTVHRILNTLKSRGYIYQDPNDLSYGIGPKFYSVGQLFQQSYSFVPLLTGYANALSQKYGECVQISVLDHFSEDCPKQLSIFRTSNDNKILSAVPAFGSISYSHCSASGKCILAFSSKSVVNKYRGCDLKKFTDHTITKWDVLEDQLKSVHNNGYATDVDELEIGLSCIAVPLLNSHGDLIAAISMLGATARFQTYSTDEIVAELQAIASKLNTL